MDLGYEQQGTGPAVIMVHGLGGTSNTFQPQASILAKRFRVIRPDLPGAGRSASLEAGSLTTVAAALLARAAAAQLRVHALARRATPVSTAAWTNAVGRQAEVRASSAVGSPAVVGLLSPTIVIPQSAIDWPPERCNVVALHELAHIHGRDVLAQGMADVACAIHWFNPLAWSCARSLRMERECAADDAVLAAGVRPSRYAEELVAVATSIAAPRGALAMAERSSLEKRVIAILAARVRRAPLAAPGAVLIAAVGSAFAAAVACASPQVVTEATRLPAAGTAVDASIQRAADEELAVITREWAPELTTIIVLDPATGEILASAGRSAGKEGDVATKVALVPGSTFKPITIAAAIEHHAITAEQKFECGPGPRRYGDKTVHDASVNGTLDVGHLLAVSSNIGTSRIFDALGGDKLAQWIHRFHFGEAPAIPGAATGVIPSSIADGSYEGVDVAIGEGLTATPLQMIAAYGALASDGVYHAPRLDRGASEAERLVSADTARSVMALLATAVEDETATGRAARVEGVHVAGKTGTAEWTAPDGGVWNYASFIGVADLPSRRIVALVGIEVPRGARSISGGSAAAPAFARLVQRVRGG